MSSLKFYNFNLIYNSKNNSLQNIMMTKLLHEFTFFLILRKSKSDFINQFVLKWSKNLT